MLRCGGVMDFCHHMLHNRWLCQKHPHRSGILCRLPGGSVLIQERKQRLFIELRGRSLTGTLRILFGRRGRIPISRRLARRNLANLVGLPAR
jgi:hypothetical protein